MQAIQPQSFRPQTTDSRHALGYSPNLLQRSPPPVQLNRVWVADITYIPLKESAFAYLALMLDLGSRRVVGWSLAEQMTETLVLDALAHAKQGEPIESCTILTTDANDLMMPIHERMPVIIPPDNFSVWLDPAVHDENVLSGMLRPFDSKPMTAYPISTKVNNPKNDLAVCIEPLEEV